MPLPRSIGEVRVRVQPLPPGGVLAVFTGQIDERSRLVALAEQLQDTVTFDLEQVTFVNSAGVAEWVRLVRRLRERAVTMRFRRCSEAVVGQMNLSAEVHQGAHVESFHAPYACTGCGHEQSACLEVEPHRLELHHLDPPALPCPRCGGAMIFTELPERYLRFLSPAGPGW